MKSRGPYRRHSTPFKLQLCQDIRNGVIVWREAPRAYGVSVNLIQLTGPVVGAIDYAAMFATM